MSKSGGGADLSTAGAGASDPTFPALLEVPLGTGLPSIANGLGNGAAVRPSDGSALAAGVGNQLSCSEGSWASNLLGAFLYRAPASFVYRWTHNGAEIAGATKPTYTPTVGGAYRCRVSATNQAGSASQTSAAREVPSLLSLKVKKRFGSNRVRARASCDLDCNLRLQGTVRVRIPGAASASARQIKTKRTSLEAGETKTLRLRLKGNGAKQVNRALRRGHRVTATVRGRAKVSGQFDRVKASRRLR